MLYLFLDIDGVFFHLGGVIYHRLTKSEAHSREELDVVSLALLREFLRKNPQTQVIISSSWRGSNNLQEFKDMFGDGIKDHIIGMTPFKKGGRGKEIKAWLDENAPNWNKDQVLILDDDADMNPLMGCLFETDSHNGFTPRDFVDLLNYVSADKKTKRKIQCKKVIHKNIRNWRYKIPWKTKLFFSRLIMKFFK